jgi:hypothetical protein
MVPIAPENQRKYDAHGAKRCSYALARGSLFLTIAGWADGTRGRLVAPRPAVFYWAETSLELVSWIE